MLRHFCNIILLLLFFVKYLSAQQSGKQLPSCAFDKVQEMLNEDHRFDSRKRFAEIESQLQRWLQNPAQKNQTARYFPNGPDFIIPVVVHIVHNGEAVGTGTNISYAQVKSQIDALNAGFSNYSASANYYQALAGAQYAGFPNGSNAVDTKIRFCLATDPGAGVSWASATEPGVMRYNSSVATRHEYSVAGQTDIANLTQPGGLFSSNNFLNIWVVTSIRFGPPVNSGDCPGIQGYASIAGYSGSEARVIEGVVIRSDIFGDNSVNSNNFPLQPIANPACPGGTSVNNANRGKILVHEVGHFLGLFHTFHECASSTASLCGTTGDLVCDTNPCDQPGVNTVCGTSDMPENFMYYSDDDILNTFTAGQSARMHAMLNTVRASLATEANVLATGVMGSQGCFAGTVMAEFTMPPVVCTNTAALFANVNNAAGSNLANQWLWEVTPATAVTIANATASSTNITFTNSGNYIVKLTVSNSGSQVTSYEQTVSVAACQIQDCRKNQLHWKFAWGYASVDFSSGLPVSGPAVADPMTADGNQESYVTETDPLTGQLLFYSNGFYVYNAAGTRLNATPFHPLAGGLENSNGQIISIPYPGHPKQYLLVIPNPGWTNPPVLSVANNYPPFNIHLVDMNGSGSVSAFPCPVNVTAPTGESLNYNQWAFGEQVTAIPHANGIDYWIVFPVRTVSGKIYIASFLVNAGGISQRSITLGTTLASLLPYGFGIVANASHNRIAVKYVRSTSGSVYLLTGNFNNRDGSFSNPLTYDVEQYGIPYAGGLVFYDYYNVYMSRTTGSQRGMLYMNLLTGTATSFETTQDFGRPVVGPDGNIYVTQKPFWMGAGSVQLARIDRFGSVPSATIVVPGSQLTPHITSPLGTNFWNLPALVQCPPAATEVNFEGIRLSCNSFQFFLTDSAVWNDYSVTWNFGDGSAPVTQTASTPVTHSYAIPGSYTVTVQLQLNGCDGLALLPAIPVSHVFSTVDATLPLPINGSTSICIGPNVQDLVYSTIASNSATYSWTLTGNGSILAPASGTGIHSIRVAFGNTPGTRTIQVTMTDGGCVKSGTLLVELRVPGSSNAGTDGSATICSSQTVPVNLFSLITGEDAGGNWIRISGSGGIFNSTAGTFIPATGATNSVFQYIIPAVVGCSSADTSYASVSINNSLSAGTDGQQNYCDNSSQMVDLFNVISGEQAGGIWERVNGTGGVFNAGAGSFTIQPGASSSSFRYILPGTNGCSNDTSIAIINIQPGANAGSDIDVAICDNRTNISLPAILQGEQPGGFWIRVSGTTGSLNSSTGLFSGPFSNENSKFAYIIAGIAPCGNDTAFVDIEYGAFDLFSDRSLSICAQSNTDLTTLYNTTGVTVIRDWFLNDNLVTNPSQVSEQGVYNLIVGNASGCRDTLFVTLEVLPEVEANAGENGIAVYGTPYQLTGSGNGNFEWSWLPSNATVTGSNTANPVATLTEPAYDFYLTVTNAAGCIGKDSVHIKVFKGPAYYLPNAFSPNNDGLNDYFIPVEVGIRSTNWFRVFNRYGQIVFNANASVKGWDGRFKGKAQDIGTYTWMISGIGNNGKLIQLKGTVVLIR